MCLQMGKSKCRAAGVEDEERNRPGNRKRRLPHVTLEVVDHGETLDEPMLEVNDEAGRAAP